MKGLKRIFSIILVLFLVILIAAFAIPYFFKDEILAKVKEEANKTLNAEVDFSDVNLSLLRNFPDFSFALSDLEVKGIEEFEGINLLNAKNIDFTLDLMSVIKSDRPLEINTISFNDVEMDVRVLADGSANYDIVKDNGDTSESESQDFVIDLEKYELTNCNITYQDKTGDVFVKIKDFNHSGYGDFTQDIFNLNTESTIDELTARTGGVNYLKRADLDIDAIINVDLPNNKFTLEENNLTVNAMTVFCEGFVQLTKGDGINIDFAFDAPQNNFKHLLSLIPGAYTKDFEDVKAEGKMAFSGYVKGVYSGRKNIFPAFKVLLDIDNGNFQYPDLPMGMKNIFTNVVVESPNLDLDKMKIDIPNFKLNLDGEPFEGRFKLRTPLSDPDVDTKMKGKIDLAKLVKTFPMEGVSELSGILNADVVMKTRMSTIDKGDYGNVNMSGSASLQQFIYKAEGLPNVKINDTQVEFTPRHAIVNDFSGKIGKSDLKASGKIDNILAYFSPNKTMTGDIKMTSQFFDINEWMTEPTEDAVATADPTAANAEIFDRFKFDFDAEIGKVAYDVYDLTDVKGEGSFSPTKLALKRFRTNIGKSDLSGNGELTNIFAYVFDNEILGGKLNLASNFFDLNELMEAGATGQAISQKIADADETFETVVIPNNVDIDVDAKMKKVIYTDMDINDMRGNIKIKDAIVNATDVVGTTLGGKFEANGSYNTQDSDKPLYDLNYDVNKMNFQKAFEKLNTFKAAVPIGKYLTGNFSTKMKMSGELTEEMMPKLESISADGFLQTINGFVNDIKPLKAIGEKLNIKYLKDHKINLKGTKNWFEIENGFVNVKEFPLDYQGINMKIEGKHSFTNEMDYNIKAKIPSKLIGKGNVGNAANTGLKFLNKQASKIGIDLNVGEFVNVLIKLKGSMTNPKIDIKLLSSEGEAASIKDVAKEVLNVVKDSVTTVVTEKVQEVKKDFTAEMNKKIDAINNEFNPRIKKLEAEADAKEAALRKRKQREIDKAKSEAYKQADLLVEKVGSNPFKKKAAEIAAKKAKEKADKIALNASAKIDGTIMKSREEFQKPIERTKKERDDKIAAIRKKYE